MTKIQVTLSAETKHINKPKIYAEPIIYRAKNILNP